ncbi:hypothetical protein ACP_1753 [Acidobacterium capsulatum ATCC 51196]|uniref:Uncharacterized protein n=1 Tax=Acidobacterium capsulatum (strain ATCC 51196 / DSM 11244 / BCRC 80197 / JCM 7670 / NBRC 15755 / NCIMB 13165 / 161) TaxID=240015 RepID=C1F7M2_ACIC5|nr:hypothetical protein ACP_1753 [Acidobacterium capsulatum ATCC 51196]
MPTTLPRQSDEAGGRVFNIGVEPDVFGLSAGAGVAGWVTEDGIAMR